MLRALRPALATTEGKLILLSSPYAQNGALYDLHRKHFGSDDSPVATADFAFSCQRSILDPACPCPFLLPLAAPGTADPPHSQQLPR
jgi:hypothetical protein